MLFSTQAAVAEESTQDLQVSTTLPGNGVPEHVYTMHNQNSTSTGGYYYANLYTAPTQTEALRALFAFYAAEVEGAYYIYDVSKGQWLSYNKAASYDSNGEQGFVTFSDTKPTNGNYFKATKATHNGNTNYQLQPYLSNGNVASTYINWFGGIGTSGNVYRIDSQTTLGIYKTGYSNDTGSGWTLTEVKPTTPAQNLLVSTSMSTGTRTVKPEHLYTLCNFSDAYCNQYTAPTTTAANRAKFAFYASDDVEGAYYIYNYTAKKWLSYTRIATDNDSDIKKVNLITLSDTKVNGAYFKVSLCVKDGKMGYQLQPYKTDNTVSPTYINWYTGVGGTTQNPLDGSVTVGVWTDPGSKDNGSAWTITETDKTISDKAVNTFSYAQSGINVTLKRTLSSEYWNTFCVPFSIDASTITEKFGVDTQLRTYGSMDGATMNFVAATEIEAGKPYLIKPGTTNTSDLEFTNVNIASGEPQAMGDAYQMVGTYGTKTLSTNGTNLFLGEGDKFYKPASEAQATMNGMRAYFVVPQGANYAALVANIDGTATAIDQINGAEVVVAAPVYNLNGQRVGNSLNGLSRGVYVQNGKKYVVK